MTHNTRHPRLQYALVAFTLVAALVASILIVRVVGAQEEGETRFTYVYLTRSLYAVSNITAGTGFITPGDISIGDDATVTDDLTVSDDLTIGDDATITGTLTIVDDLTIADDTTLSGDVKLTAQTAITTTNGAAFAPTGAYQPIGAAGTVTPTITVAAAGVRTTICNEDNVTINIADSGTAKLTAAFGMGQYDCLSLQSDGTNWLEISRANN
jgi:hypothetical protein